MENIFNNIEQYILIFNKEGNLKFCNTRLLSKLEYNLDELLDVYNVEKIISENIEELIDKEIELNIKSKRNNYIHLKGLMLKSTFKGCDSLVFISKDDKAAWIDKGIINHEDFEKEKRQALEEEVNFMLSTDTHLMCITDSHGRFLKIGRGWTEILGWTYDDIKDMKWYELFRLQDKRKVLASINRCRKEEKKVNGINLYRCKNGDYRFVCWQCIYVKERDIFIGSAKDITEEKRLEEEAKKYENALMLESLKNKFFANISHEFKTPLNIICAAAQLIDYRAANDINKKTKDICLRRYAKSIKHNSYRLLRIVNNIIDMSKIDSENYELKLLNYDIVYLLENVIESVRTYVKGKKINIIFDPEVEELIIACDAKEIERIILNLISNSIKYAKEECEVYISLKVEDNFVIISIEDNGIGIEEEHLETIFQRFKQVDNTFRKRVEGSGIGLSLVKSLVELHGGRIWAESRLNEGTTMTFCLPLISENNEKMNYVKSSIDSQIEGCNIEFSDIYDFVDW